MLLGKEKITRRKINPITGVSVKEIYNPELNRYYCRVHQNFKDGQNIHTKPFDVLCNIYGCTTDINPIKR